MTPVETLLTWRPDSNSAMAAAVGLVVVLVGSAVGYYLTKRLLTSAVARAARRTDMAWDDALLEHKVVHRVADYVPVVIVYALAPVVLPGEAVVEVVQRGALIASVIVAAALANALLSVASDMYGATAAAREFPIRGPVQVARLAIFLVSGLLVVAVLLDRSPLVLLTGLGALSAVFMLVFRDPILGFVAGIQLSSNRMLAPGDWIEMPKYDADGDVMEVGLTTVKVRNWDKTITSIPTYALISESFRNWRGMEESGGRRIKRSLLLDIRTVRFCTPEMLDRYARIERVADHVRAKRREVREHNSAHGVDVAVPVNGRRLTNIGTFRAYIEAYLRNHPMINQDMTVLVRQLAPTTHGVPIEAYAFCSDTTWARYEAVQADIFDHLVAAAPAFDLALYQQPSGHDLDTLEAVLTEGR